MPNDERGAEDQPGKSHHRSDREINSPPIISKAAPVARMPSWAAGAMKFMMPASVNIAGFAVKKKKMVTSTRPATAPSSGRRRSAVIVETFFSRSSE
ncbi:hypothetical protein AJ88_01880 [Mesorhizobium amorphae CCBAU 01583]|nr:hypothetical protein AJ88_01880 [Mesorhizobium amorphae CCBAU 01583]